VPFSLVFKAYSAPAAGPPRGKAASAAPALKAGLTLVELLIVMVLMIMVGGVAFTLYQVSARYSVQQQAVLEQMQNLRAALYTVARDVRMAGNGLRFIGVQKVQIYLPAAYADPSVQAGSGWFRYKGASADGVRAIYGTNGGAAGPDTLTLFRSESESAAALGQLKAAYMPGGANQFLSLRDPIKADALADGDMIAVADGSTAVILQAGSYEDSNRRIVIGPRFKPEAALPGGAGLPEGAKVYNLRNVTFVTYYIDVANHRLMANYYDAAMTNNDLDDVSRRSVTVANDIEDFQVSYFLNQAGTPTMPAAPEINEGLLANRWVRGASLALVSRSPRKSETAGEGAPLEVMDHTSVGPPDGHSRRIITEIINLRNF
jgi:type II secretory pathway pseudopilin PulG